MGNIGRARHKVQQQLISVDKVPAGNAVRFIDNRRIDLGNCEARVWEPGYIADIVCCDEFERVKYVCPDAAIR